MRSSQKVVGLSLVLSIGMLVYACQPDSVQDNRSATSSSTTPANSNADSNKPADAKPTNPAGDTKPGTPATPAATTFTMSWDASTDPGVVSYKIFVVPPDRNPRFPGKTDIPILVKNYPLASLKKDGTKYSIPVSSDEVKTALGSIAVSPSAYCFSIVAVNNVGNSNYSPLICPQ